MLGVSVPSYVRWAPRGWEASFRNAGTLEGRVLGPHHAQLVYSNLPAFCTASDGWLKSSQGSAYGALDVLRVEGIVRLDLSARSTGRMVLDLEWTGPVRDGGAAKAR